MVSQIDEMADDRSSLGDVKMSTVVPASIAGENKTYQFGSVDLAMKLHYVTTVHFFGADAAQGLGNDAFKSPMFHWLQFYYPISGRIRRSDGGGRPFVKCNDSGVRIVEVKCSKTVAEWLESAGAGDHHRLLVYHQPVLAHDFGFTPLVFLQLTQFKCGGMSVGMRWSHALGDAFSATECINGWGKIMAGQKVPHFDFFNTSIPPNHHSGISSSSSSQALKLLEPLGDNWLTPNNCKLQMHAFHLTEKHLNDYLQYGKHQNGCNDQVRPFELISAIVWRSLAKIRGDDAKVVTVCKKGSSGLENGPLGNRSLVIGTVEAAGAISSVTDSDPVELAKMIGEKLVDETSKIEGQIEEGNGVVDCIVYGSNLTFIDLEGVSLCGLEINGRLPVYADLSIGGVGDGGAVVVVPYAGQEKGGTTVNAILPEDQLQHLKDEMGGVWGNL